MEYIGLLGNKGCGKDTLADYLVKDKNFIKYSFANPIKEIAKHLFNLSDEQLNGSHKETIDNRWNLSPRIILQRLGTEFGQYKIYDLFQTGSPFNFNDFQDRKGAVIQTILLKVDVIIHNQNKNEVNLFVRRSFSQHLFSWMNDSASRL